MLDWRYIPTVHALQNGILLANTAPSPCIDIVDLDGDKPAFLWALLYQKWTDPHAVDTEPALDMISAAH